jgi:Tol biopolymer transport system component
VFSSLKGGVRSLWQVPLKTHAVPIQIGGENALQPVIDPSGRRIVYERITVNDTLQVLSVCGAHVCDDAQPRRLAYSREVARNPSWSPDGKQIAFESIEHGHVQVWRCNSDGSNPVMVSDFNSPVSGTPHWSPDGNFLVMDSAVDKHSKLFLAEVPKGVPRQLTTGDWEDITPSFSHDGKTIYFASNRSGAFQVWKLALATGLATQVTRSGGFYAVESSDGRTLFYSKGMQRTEIGEVPVSGGNERTVIQSLSYWPDFSVSTSGIYFIPAKIQRGGVPVYFRRFADGKEVQVATIPGVDMQGMSLASNGRDLLFAVRSSVETNLMSLNFGVGGR